MRVLAIDYGTKSIGVAVSDELQLTARPLTTIRRRKQSRRQIISKIQALIEDQQAGNLVVGLPVRMDGSIGEAAEKVRAFIVELQKIISVPVIEQDERLTSQAAEEWMRELGFNQQERKEKSDEYAAAIILRDYLESRH